LAAGRDEHGHREIAGADLAAFARSLGDDPEAGAGRSSARNRLKGIVTAVVRDGVMAQVDIQAGPYRVVSLMSREAVEELDLQVGSVAIAVHQVDHRGGRAALTGAAAQPSSWV